MKLLHDHKEEILLLSKAHPALIKKIIKSAPPSLVDALTEAALNVLNGNLHLTPRERALLKKFKTKLRSLAATPSVKSRKRILQSGKFIGVLAGIIAPLIIDGIIKLATRKKRKSKNQKGKGVYSALVKLDRTLKAANTRRDRYYAYSRRANKRARQLHG